MECKLAGYSAEANSGIVLIKLYWHEKLQVCYVIQT